MDNFVATFNHCTLYDFGFLGRNSPSQKFKQGTKLFGAGSITRCNYKLVLGVSRVESGHPRYHVLMVWLQEIWLREAECDQIVLTT